MNFALLTCPHSPDQIRDGRPLLKWLPQDWLPDLTRFLGVSVKGYIQVSRLNGCLLDFPILPGQTGQAGKKAAQAAKKIVSAGARVVGLDTGLRSLAPVFCKSGLAVSYGSALQVAAAVSILFNYLRGSGDIRALIVDPITPPGAVCARLLAPRVRHLTLMGNFLAPLQRLAGRILLETGTAPVITRFDPNLFALADLVIDLAGVNLTEYAPLNSALIWQPWAGAEYMGPARVITEVLVELDTDLVMEGDLPAGLLRASTAEAIFQGMGVERVWPRNAREVTADQVLRIWNLAEGIGMQIAGYTTSCQVSLLPKKIGFDN